MADDMSGTLYSAAYFGPERFTTLEYEAMPAMLEKITRGAYRRRHPAPALRALIAPDSFGPDDLAVREALLREAKCFIPHETPLPCNPCTVARVSGVTTSSTTGFRPCTQEETVRKTVLGLFMALTVVLAVAPLADAGQTETAACCGGGPGFP